MDAGYVMTVTKRVHIMNTLNGLKKLTYLSSDAKEGMLILNVFFVCNQETVWDLTLREYLLGIFDILLIPVASVWDVPLLL